MTFSTFAARLNETFTATHGPASVELTLTECAPLPNSNNGFSLTFHGPLSPYLPQQIHALQNPALGEIHIFLVPLGPAGTIFQYEAIFN
jgi:hypothetical protein